MATLSENASGERIAAPERAPADLLDVNEVADRLHVSVRTVHRLSDAGRMPRPLKLNSLSRWRSAEIDQWVADGCPTLRKAKGGGR